MNVRCKVRCDSVEMMKSWKPENGYLYNSKFSAVSDGSYENKDFFVATPSLQLNIGCHVFSFLPGKEYYIDVIEAN